MNTLTWTLLLGGVLLNAAAQLLLKAATRISGVLLTDAGNMSTWRIRDLPSNDALMHWRS